MSVVLISYFARMHETGLPVKRRRELYYCDRGRAGSGGNAAGLESNHKIQVWQFVIKRFDHTSQTIL